MALALLWAACSGGDDVSATRSGRNVVASAWDTVLAIGSRVADDTTLIDPTKVRAWGDNVVVLEDLAHRVQVFDRAGQRRWTFGEEGQGPGEIASADGILISPSGHLGIWDGRNRKLLKVNAQGELVREQPFRGRWGLSSTPFTFGGRIVWTQLSPTSPTYISDSDGLNVIDSVSFRWPVPDDLPYPPNLAAQADGTSELWVQGLWMGPYFAVGRHDSASVHPYVHEIPYSAAAYAQMGPTADSAYFGAWDVAVSEEEIFFLSGGRPRRYSHPGEPTNFVDVYDYSGLYLRSYELPFDAISLAVHGETFLLVTSPMEQYPQVFGLKPRK